MMTEIDGDRIARYVRKGYNQEEIAVVMKIPKGFLSLYIKHHYGSWKKYRDILIFGKKGSPCRRKRKK